MVKKLILYSIKIRHTGTESEQSEFSLLQLANVAPYSERCSAEGQETSLQGVTENSKQISLSLANFWNATCVLYKICIYTCSHSFLYSLML